jgi:uncharacterized protein
MELGLLSYYWKKLMEALRFKEDSAPKARIDPANRESDSFTVISGAVTLKGRLFFPAAKPAMLYPALIICHGIPSGRPADPNDPGYESLAREFASLGIGAAIFNFRGCGESSGNFEMLGWARDLEAVIDTILNTPHIDPTRLMVLGFSGGGAAAIKAAADTSKIFSLATVGTPSDFSIFAGDLDEIINDFRSRGLIRDPGFPTDPTAWMEEFRKIEPKKWVSQFRGKHLMIMHGDEDEVVPVEQAHELYEHAPSGITKLSIISGGEHRLRLNPEALEIMKSWFLQTLGWGA